MVCHPTSTPEGWRRVDDDAGHAEPAVKQVLRDGAAERVSERIGGSGSERMRRS